MRGCLDEGIIQSYVDGELSPAMTESAAQHIAACAACAEAVRQVESEMLQFAAVFASDVTASVPSERLRERLDAAIAGLNAPMQNTTLDWPARLRALLAPLTALLTPRQAAAFATLILAAFALIFAVVHSGQPEQEIAKNLNEVVPVIPSATPLIARAPKTGETEAPVINDKQNETIAQSGPKKPMHLVPTIHHHKSEISNTGNSNPNATTPNKRNNDVLLPGERSYIQAIASLTTVIEKDGEKTMPPTLRAEYERNLAVVDHAIVTTRIAARRNPNNPDATDFLLAAYQSKIDLLSAVADQAQTQIAAR